MTRHRFLVFVAAGAAMVGACNAKSVGNGDPSRPDAHDVFLEATKAPGQKPFTHSVAVAPVPDAPPPRPGAAGRSVRGTATGLYGGLTAQSPCDATFAVNALTGAEDAAAQNWVDALNRDRELSWSGGSKLSAADIAAYIGELTPVFLQSDTRVTDHGLGSSAFQAVLERGTAVMIDSRGIPRARCASFSPLLPPKTVDSPVYRGERWTRFDPKKLTVVTPGGVVDSFRAVNVHTRRLFDLPVGQQVAPSFDTTTTSTTVAAFEGEVTTTTSRRSTTTTTKKPTTTTARPTTTTPVTAAPTTTAAPPPSTATP